MMEWTDRHFRFFIRCLSRRTLLYTPMITADAILRGKRDELLAFSAEEHPLGLQLGGSDPKKLAAAAKIAEDVGYDEINLNVGCPSDRVKEGSFGACLMATPEAVAEIIAAIKRAVRLPVTVKHRIGIDDLDSYDHLQRFVRIVSQGGCNHFIVHARKAWLSGVSPKRNRSVPPLRYDEVYQLKRDFSDLTIVINGGIRSLSEVKRHLQQVDGVMLGRAAYEDPFLFAEVDREIFGEKQNVHLHRTDVLARMIDYAKWWIKEGGELRHITRHLFGLYFKVPGAKPWRRLLSDHELISQNDPELLQQSIFAEFGVERRPANI